MNWPTKKQWEKGYRLCLRCDKVMRPGEYYRVVRKARVSRQLREQRSRVSLQFRLSGGGGSLLLTLLRPNSLREKYREFREFSRPIPTVSSGKRLILDSFRCHESVFGPNRTGNYQGRIREFAFPVNPGLQGNLGSLHLAIKRSPEAPDLHGRHEDNQPQNLTFEKLFACQCLPG